MKTCEREGCDNPLGPRNKKYCSKECRLRATQDGLPECAREGCHNKVHVPSKQKYCSRDCYVASGDLREAAIRGAHASRFANDQRLAELEEYNKFWTFSAIDTMIAGDWHVPYFDKALADRVLDVASAHGIKNILVPGDFLDLYGFSKFPRQKHQAWEEEKDAARVVMDILLANFENIYFLTGNHELRLFRLLSSLGADFGPENVWELILKNDSEGRAQVSTYPFCHIGQNPGWMIVHPGAFRKKSLSLPYELATIHHRNIISAHAHHIGWTRDPSHKFKVCDSGCLVNPKLVEYKAMRVTAHPNWAPGFLMLKNNHLYIFEPNEDWDFWLNGKDN